MRYLVAAAAVNAERALFRLDGTMERPPASERTVHFKRWSVVLPWRGNKDAVLFTMEAG